MQIFSCKGYYVFFRRALILHQSSLYIGKFISAGFHYYITAWQLLWRPLTQSFGESFEKTRLVNKLVLLASTNELTETLAGQTCSQNCKNKLDTIGNHTLPINTGILDFRKAN